jgi:hypothetical protein
MRVINGATVPRNSPEIDEAHKGERGDHQLWGNEFLKDITETKNGVATEIKGRNQIRSSRRRAWKVGGGRRGRGENLLQFWL